MSSGFIPKEKLSAYERWELGALDDGGEGGLVPPESAAPAAPAKTAVPLPTAEEIEHIHNEAYAAGHAAGVEAGRSEGLAAGLAEGRAAGQAEAGRIAALVDQLGQSLQQLDQEVAEQLLDVAIEIASQVLRQSLRLRPDLLLPTVREAVAALPLHHGHPALYLHPDDAALVRDRLGDQLTHNGWRIIEDATMTPGGCRVEAGASEVDATLETRWQRVLEAIGASRDWLDAPP